MLLYAVYGVINKIVNYKKIYKSVYIIAKEFSPFIQLLNIFLINYFYYLFDFRVR